MKRIAILPTLLTLGNGVCGLFAIILTSRIDPNQAEFDPLFAQAALLLLVAMLFDVLDGYVARLSKTASSFGGELDSLCDAVSFGTAPAILILKMSPPGEFVLVRNLVYGIAVLFMVCALLRLARFNVENTPEPGSHRRFKGLPSPAAAGCIVSLAILRSQVAADWLAIERDLILLIVRFWALIGGLAVALLMVSRVGYPHMTKQLLRGRRHFGYLLRIILAVFLLALARELSVLILFWGYALLFLGRHMVLRVTRSEEVSGPLPQADAGPETDRSSALT